MFFFQIAVPFICFFLHCQVGTPCFFFGGAIFTMKGWVNRAQWFLSRYTENARSSFFGREDKLKANNFKTFCSWWIQVYVFSPCFLLDSWCFCLVFLPFQTIWDLNIRMANRQYYHHLFCEQESNLNGLIATFEMPWGGDPSQHPCSTWVFMVALLRFHLRIQAQPKTIGIWWDFL